MQGKRAHGSTCGRSTAGGDGLAVRFFVATGLAAGPDEVGLVGTITPAAPNDGGASGVWMENEAGGTERARGVWSSSDVFNPSAFTGAGTASAMPGSIGGTTSGSAPPV